MTASARNRRPRGFTLIELLVVIAILGMLIGIFLPSLRGARKQARNTQCLNRLRDIYLAYATYIHDHRVFTPLNKEWKDNDEGSWQYNYLIYDGYCSDDSCGEFDYNFGPLLDDALTIQSVEQLYCPVQKHPWHSLATPRDNPWPVVSGADTRAGYGRRYHLTGKSLSQFRNTIAIVADVLHLSRVIKSAHETGVNAVYLDGHARWVEDRHMLKDINKLGHPFDPLDNEIMEDIWDALDEAK